MKSLVETLHYEAQLIANKTPRFFDSRGAGKGNLSTNNFMAALSKRMKFLLGIDYSEKQICIDNSFAVDYYFPTEKTIVEIALGLKRPNSEFEKDIFKAIIAKENNLKVEKLVLIAKEGGLKKCQQPARKKLIEWAKNRTGIEIEVLDLLPNRGI